MNPSPRSTYVYVTYIRTTPEKLWSALTTPDFIKRYWFGMDVQCDFEAGSKWRLAFEDGRTADDGIVIEADPPKRLVIRWTNRWKPEMEAEGETLCTFEIAQEGTATRLSVTHSIEKADSKFIGAVAGGWPKILSNLKSLLETGTIALESK